MSLLSVLSHRSGGIASLVCTLVLTFIGSAPVFSGSTDGIPIFDSALPRQSNGTSLLNRDQCSSVEIDGEPYLDITKDRDPYSKVEWQFQFEPDSNWWNKPVVLEIRFLDKGAGIIEPKFLDSNTAGTKRLTPSRQGSYTRLNTSTVRSAFFSFDLSGTHWEGALYPHLIITGLQSLREIRIHPSFDEGDWAVVKESIPKRVEPMIHLRNPVQLVTTAGINSKGSADTLQQELETLDELAPLAKVLGFTSIESYVRWNWIEPLEEGKFDFQTLDSIVERLRKHDLKWFPLLVVGSAYALPEWFKKSEENVGFVCLEHGLSNGIQSIWSPYHQRHVSRVLQALGNRYDSSGILEGIRLGPSGNYGESQYPAGGNWPAVGEDPMHIHIGYWAGDLYAQKDFREFVLAKYQTLETINRVWGTDYKDPSEILPPLPVTIPNYRFRLDMTQWYTDSMTEWCDWWVRESAKAFPKTKIYQSSGGWGFREAGTDYSAQTESMIQVNGGIRLTNETDSFDQNYYATRLAATAARLYGVDLGYEPASSHTARGIVGRIFNTVTTNGDHLFTYHSNILHHQMSIDKWLENLPLLDNRQDPLVEVAVYYPETMNQLEDATFRHLYAWGFNPRAREVRNQVEVDYLDEHLIRDGFLDRYKVLVHVWGDLVEADVLSKIDEWIRKGGTVIYPSFPKGDWETIEGDRTHFTEWQSGNTGEGAFHRYRGDMEPPSLYGDYVREILLKMQGLHPWTRATLEAVRSDRVFASIQQDGHLMVLNYSDKEGTIQLPSEPEILLGPYEIRRIELKTEETTETR